MLAWEHVIVLYLNRTLPELAWHQSGKAPAPQFMISINNHFTAQSSQNLLQALWLAVTANVFISFYQLSDLISRCRLHTSAKIWKQHHACFMPERESSLLSVGGRQMQLLFVLLLVVSRPRRERWSLLFLVNSAVPPFALTHRSSTSIYWVFAGPILSPGPYLWHPSLHYADGHV